MRAGSAGAGTLTGGELTLAGGLGGGSGTGGAVVIQTAASSSLSERMRIDNQGVAYIGNGATSSTPSNGTLRGTGGSGSGVAGATLTVSGGANSGSGNSNGGGLTLIAPTANASGTKGALTLTAHGQSYTFNDASNVTFTGAATGATSLVGAINQVASGTGAGSMSTRPTQFQSSGLTLTSAIAAGVLAANGDTLTISAWGDGALTLTVFGTTVLSAVASGTSAYWTQATLIRTSSGNVDVIANFSGSAGAPTRTAVAADNGNIVSTAGTTGVARGQLVFKAADA